MYLRYLNDATATCTERRSEAREYSGALYDSNGRLVEESIRNSEAAAWKQVCEKELSLNSSQAVYKHGKYLYLGHLHIEFGHFLIETVSSLKFSSWFKEVCLVFHPFTFDGVSLELEDYEYITSIFRILDISIDKVYLVEVNTVFEEVVVPERLVKINQYYDASALSVYREISRRASKYVTVGENSEKIFLSRSQLKRKRRAFAYEDELDNFFELKGYTVYYPEQHDIVHQINTVSSASVVAGMEGSAMHLSLFMRSGARVFTIHNRINPNITMCNHLAQIDEKSLLISDENINNSKAVESQLDNYMMKNSL